MVDKRSSQYIKDARSSSQLFVYIIMCVMYDSLLSHIVIGHVGFLCVCVYQTNTNPTSIKILFSKNVQKGGKIYGTIVYYKVTIDEVDAEPNANPTEQRMKVTVTSLVCLFVH